MKNLFLFFCTFCDFGDQYSASPFEVLHSTLVALGGFTTVECAQVFTLAGPRIFLARVKTVLT
jgi:hypothetical protein